MGNTVSFSVALTRLAEVSFDITANTSEQNGKVVYGEIVGNYNPVNPVDGDTDVANLDINSYRELSLSRL